LFAGVAAVGLLGGFRSYLAQILLILAALFIVEGLHRTRYLPMLLGVTLLGAVIVLPQAQKLPLVMQRSMAFLPGNFDPAARESASNSTEWRLVMWTQVWPDVPRYLFRGKGFGLDSGDLYLAGVAERRYQSEALAGTITAGDYHNGPLSILIPLGIYGMIAFVWFLIAAMRVLHLNWKYGDPAHQRVNALLLAAFVAHAIFFFVGFGAISSDMVVFVGLLGLGVALNGADAYQPAPVEEVAPGVELNTEYIKA
jgi:O-antigen ligase